MKWDQVHFSDSKLYVARRKNGDPVFITSKATKCACFANSSEITPTPPFSSYRKKVGHFHRAPFEISSLALARSLASTFQFIHTCSAIIPSAALCRINR